MSIPTKRSHAVPEPSRAVPTARPPRPPRRPEPVRSREAARAVPVAGKDARPATAGPARAIRSVSAPLPGLAVAVVSVGAAWGTHVLLPAMPMLTAALVLGVLAANLGVLPATARPGLRFAASGLMRAGIVLLGLQVALSDILGLGWETIVMAVAVLLATLFGTRRLGRWMGLPEHMSLLVAAGFAICGASAVAAVDGAARDGDRDERATATAVALVTLCGTLAIAVLPPAGRVLGLAPYDLGRWIGASVHDVGQVVATATIAGPVAVVPAVAVKLVRVAMLAPVAAVTALRSRRADGVADGRRPPMVPLFLVGFLAMAVLRTTGVVPRGILHEAGAVKDLLFAAALFGLGAGVRLRELVRTGHRALLLGLTSWLLVAGVAYAGVLLTR